MIKLGMNCKLFRGPAGQMATTLMTNVKNVSLDMSTGTADITTRTAEGWRVNVATLREGSVTTEMLYDPADADFAAVNQAFLTNTPLALFVGDGDGNGFDADFVVSNFSQNQDLENAVTVSVTFSPTLAGRAPRYVIADESDSGSDDSDSSSSSAA